MNTDETKTYGLIGLISLFAGISIGLVVGIGVLVGTGSVVLAGLAGFVTAMGATLTLASFIRPA